MNKFFFHASGHYCVGGVALPCPAGTYGPQDGLQKLQDCTICPAGINSGSNGTWQKSILYSVYFQFVQECRFVNGISCKGYKLVQNVSQGFYCLEGSSQRPNSQFLCPQGFFCEEGTATPHGSPCPAGTAGEQLGQTSRAACKRCKEGWFCPAGKS